MGMEELCTERRGGVESNGERNDLISTYEFIQHIWGNIP